MSIRAENLVWSMGQKTIVDGVSFTAPQGKIVGLLGPNGSGKTSLLRLIAGLKPPTSGRVTLEGVDIRRIPRRALAARVAFVEQHATTNLNLRVIDVVKLGRFPHRSMLSGWTIADDRPVEAAIERAGLTHLRHASWQTLSGGERQRVHIARALAQTPLELILDEPTNHLDIQHQIALLQLVVGLGITSLIALHDLNHAAMFCDELIVMKAGHIVASGTPDQVLTEALLRDVFSVTAYIEPSAHHGRPHIQYLR